MLRRAALVALSTVLAAAGSALAALPSQAASEEVYLVPSDGTFDLSGRGFGHGLGMSQYGAKGGAERGVRPVKILSAYYPGTTLDDVGNPRMRVVLTSDGYGPTRGSSASSPFFRVAGGAGLRLVDFRGRSRTRTGDLPRRVNGSWVTTWGVSVSGSRLSLQAFYGGAWHAYTGVSAPDGSTLGVGTRGPLEVRSAGETVTMRGLDGGTYPYRGALRAKAVSSSSLARVNVVPMEDYLLGVVPSEMPASWHTFAVRAQSVAARTFAESRRRANDGNAWHVDDTINNQVYKGVNGEHPDATTKITGGTRVLGTVLVRNGSPITAFFSSSNGGWEVDGGLPYLPARADAWDPVNEWSGHVSASCLSSRYGGGKAVKRLVVTKRDGHGAGGGRVTALRLEFSGGGTKSITGTGELGAGNAVRLALGACDDYSSSYLRSNFFTVDAPTPSTGTAGGGGSVEVTDPHRHLGVAPIRAGKALLATRATNGAVWVRTWTAWNGPGTPTKLRGEVRGAPAVVRGPGGRLEVFGRRAGDNRLVTRVRPGRDEPWRRWRSRGGALRSSPAAAAADGRVFVFARGTDDTLVSRSRPVTGGSWSAWTDLGGALASSGGPAAVATGDGRLHVLVHRADGRLGLRTRWATGRWSRWKDLGGRVTGTPAAASDTVGRFTAVVRARKGRVRVLDVVGRRPGAWTGLGGSVRVSPVVTGVPGTSRLDVLATTRQTNELVRRTRVDGTWRPWRDAD